MYENFTQRCVIYGHNELQISGLCLNQECQTIPQSCQNCNQNFHFDHIQDVQNSSQVRHFLKEMEQQITNILIQYEEIWKKIQSRYKQFYSDIAYQKLLIQQHLKKEIEIYYNSDLNSLSKQIKELKINRSLQNNVVNNNLKQLKLFYSFFEDTDYVYPFTFKPKQDYSLNQELTKLSYKFSQIESIDIYPNLDTIQKSRFKFILKVLEIKQKVIKVNLFQFQLVLQSKDSNNTIFSINQDGLLTDDQDKSLELGQKIIKGTIIILSFTFSDLKRKKNVKIEILQQNKDNIKYIHEFSENYHLDLKLVCLSDQGQLQIIHDLV